ncbi:hypothetical protein [Micromonospora maris]|uniref:hypothetical protein n=1 Tax=Micromonospora maris TaxID=1003110 RepID=UPI002E113518|nr:hypothetical protein OG712_19405 [Micromonospora maris]
MSNDQQPDGGIIWNVRALVGDLADELPPESSTGRPQESPAGRPQSGRPVGGPAASDATGPIPQPPVRGEWVSSGQVVPQSSGISMGKAVVAAGVTLLVMVVALVVAVGSIDDDTSTGTPYPDFPAGGPQYLPPEDAGLPTPEPSFIPTTEPAEPTFDDPEDLALAQLHQFRQQDLPTVSLAGQYVAQLASKTVGIVDRNQFAANGSHTFYAEDILAEHLDLRNRFDGETQVVLLLSTDYGRQQLYEGEPLWITLALPPGSSKEAVARWCANQFPQLTGTDLDNQCVPRRLNPVGSS